MFTYTYDAGGRPLMLEYPEDTGIVAHFEGPDEEVGWDGNGQLLHLRYVKDATETIRRFQYEYDDAGNRISQLDVTPTKATSWAYGYDWLDRLETVKKAEADIVANLGALQLVSVYEYDAADNRIKFEVPALDELYESFYDDADNITRIDKTVGVASAVTIETFTSDDDGNLLTRTDPATSVVTTYQWDDFNRLAAISTTDDSKKQTNTFGVNGFRRKKKDKNDVETTEYAAGLATAVSKVEAAETITYLMGHGLMGFERSSDGAMFYFLTDALSSVRDIVDGTGTVVQQYEFDERGNHLIPPMSGGPASPKTFVGGLSVNDDTADSGLYLMGHRFYDPSIMRFLNRDPIGFAGGLNLYEAMRSNPVTFVDPDGLDPWTFFVYSRPDGITVMQPDEDFFVDVAVATALIAAGISAIEATAAWGAINVAVQMGRPIPAWAWNAVFGPEAVAALTGGAAAFSRKPCSTNAPIQGPSPKIHWGRQGKHIPGHNDYIKGRSPLTADPTELGRHAGMGQKANKIDVGLPGSKERVNFEQTIGEYINKGGTVSLPTPNGLIIYSKDGIHIIPSRP